MQCLEFSELNISEEKENIEKLPSHAMKRCSFKSKLIKLFRTIFLTWLLIAYWSLLGGLRFLFGYLFIYLNKHWYKKAANI